MTVLLSKLEASLAAESEFDDLVYNMGVAEDWWFDTYDCSLELSGVEPGWHPSEEHFASFRDAGFVKVYVSYTDNTGLVFSTQGGPGGQCEARESKDRRGLIDKLNVELEKLRAEREQDFRTLCKIIDTITTLSNERDQLRFDLETTQRERVRAIRIACARREQVSKHIGISRAYQKQCANLSREIKQLHAENERLRAQIQTLNMWAAEAIVWMERAADHLAILETKEAR